jgi:hypothetical protein
VEAFKRFLCSSTCPAFVRVFRLATFAATTPPVADEPLRLAR